MSTTKSAMNIKRENSASFGSDCESFPINLQDYSIQENKTDNEHYLETPMNIKNEDSVRYGSDCGSNSPERDDVMSFEDIMKYEAASQSIKDEFGSSKFDDNQFSLQNIKSEPREENQPKWISEKENEMIANSRAVEKAHYKIGGRAKKLVSIANDSSDSNEQKSDGTNYSNEANDIESDSSSTLEITVNLTYTHKNLKCSFCNKDFRSTRDRMDHENTHTGNRPHTCRICSKSFASTSSLHKHIQLHPGAFRPKKINRSAPTGPKIFECSFCGKTLKGTRDRDEHENTHTGSRPHKCRICPKRFTSSSSLRRHDRVHKDDRRHECQVCKKRFIIKSKLDKHIRANHLPDSDPRRYFPCQLCDAKLGSYSQLDIHRRKEHRNNSLIFTCDCCQKQYKKKESIVEHMRIHSGKKPLKCNHCEKTFMQKYSKTKHERKCTNSVE